MSDGSHVAVLIDCDNISWRQVSPILAEASTHGVLSIKRAYGDWSSGSLVGWRGELARHGLQPVQQFAYVAGKNATDMALVIDGMDLLYAGNIDVFCIVASDSDYTRLSMRLRESGRRVYGIGAKTTAVAFQQACDRFTFLHLLAPADAAPDVVGPDVVGPGEGPRSAAAGRAGTAEVAGADAITEVGEAPVPELRDIVTAAINACARDDGWALLGSVGSYIVNNHPTFDSRTYGHQRLGALVRSLDYVEVREVPDPTGFAQLSVRLRSQRATS